MNAIPFGLGHLKRVKAAVRSSRDYWHFRPLPWFKAKEVVRGAFSSVTVAEILKKDGICILQDYLDQERLHRVKHEAERIFAESQRLSPHGTNKDPVGFYACLIDFKRFPFLAELIMDELVLAAIEAYFGKNIYLDLSQIKRLLPVEPYEYGSFQWHHDMRGKCVKAMWLLTDVSPVGQRMSYMAGSHLMRHVGSTYEESRFSEDRALECGRLVECIGPAGTVVIFDTNGLHRGNRNWGATRDTLVGAFSAGRHRQGCEFDLSTLPPLKEWQIDILRRSRTASKGYSPTAEK